MPFDDYRLGVIFPPIETGNRPNKCLLVGVIFPSHYGLQFLVKNGRSCFLWADQILFGKIIYFIDFTAFWFH
jgi:hypothetical protein